jgi:glycosyltransferase involved in cell wall biosynthesis
MKMCQAFLELGYSINLITSLRTKKKPDIDNKLWTHYGIRTPFPITWLSSESIFTSKLYYFSAIKKAKNFEAELIYTRNIAVAALSSMIGIPVVYEAHDLPSGKVGPWYFRRFLSGNGYRLLVAISDALGELFKYHYSPHLEGKRMIKAPDGVDLERYNDLPLPPEARRLIGLNPTDFTIGYTGHLYPGRGIEIIIQLAQHFQDIKFLIIGGEPKTIEEKRHAVKKLNINNINFPGFIDNSALPLYQAACEVLLMPYLKKIEGSSGGDISKVLSPMKMFEYMAAGRLIIASDLPVFREVLNENNSLLCDPEDISSWKKAIEKSTTDQAWRLALGYQARRDVEKYSWKQRVNNIMRHV